MNRRPQRTFLHANDIRAPITISRQLSRSSERIKPLTEAIKRGDGRRGPGRRGGGGERRRRALLPGKARVRSRCSQTRRGRTLGTRKSHPPRFPLPSLSSPPTRGCCRSSEWKLWAPGEDVGGRKRSEEQGGRRLSPLGSPRAV